MERGQIVVKGIDIDAERVAVGLGGFSPVAVVTAAAAGAVTLAQAADGEDLSPRIRAAVGMVGGDLSAVARERDPFVLMVLVALDRRLSAQVGRHPSFARWRGRVRNALVALGCLVVWAVTVLCLPPAGRHAPPAAPDWVLAAACGAGYLLIVGAVAAWAVGLHLRIDSKEISVSGVTTVRKPLACRKLPGLCRG